MNAIDKIRAMPVRQPSDMADTLLTAQVIGYNVSETARLMARDCRPEYHVELSKLAILNALGFISDAYMESLESETKASFYAALDTRTREKTESV